MIVEDVLELSWSDQELLVVQETPKASGSSWAALDIERSFVFLVLSCKPRQGVFRMLMQLTLLLGLLHTTMRNCSSTMAAAKTNSQGCQAAQA